MTIRKIVTLENPTLRQKARKVTRFTPDLQTLIDDMVETMRAAPGVGLAAPQVGQGMRLFVAEYAESRDPDEEGAEASPPKLYVLINPETVRVSEEKVEGEEGCLSIPGYAGTVERHEAVTVKALNRRGQPIKLKAQGWLARIFQHEIDHLEGVLFIDKASKVWKMEEKEEAAEERV